MTKKLKILICLLIALLLLVLYLILTSESATNKNQSASIEKTNIQMENEYIKQAKEIFSAYNNLTVSDNFTREQVSALKNQLLELKVPTKFKELHINLVMAMTKMENFFDSNNEEEKTSGQQIISQLKNDYSWLN